MSNLDLSTNFLFYGDNLDVLRRYIPDNCVDLVYLDPPFKSNQDYNILFAEKDGEQSSAQILAFEDTWRWDQSAAADPYAFLRKSLEHLNPAPPGEVVRVVIDMWATGIRIFRGHRIRLEVASAALPKFAAHTNTLDPPGSTVRTVIATNTVWHEADRASRVVLPVIET